MEHAVDLEVPHIDYESGNLNDVRIMIMSIEINR